MARIRQSFRMAELTECSKPECDCVHFFCPFCGNEASVKRDNVTQVFSVTCHEGGELFLVDMGEEQVQ